MNCPYCESPDVIVTDRIQTSDGTVILKWCLDCLTEIESLPSERVDRKRDAAMVERSGAD